MQHKPTLLIVNFIRYEANEMLGDSRESVRRDE
jgi:hypothetical protein